MKISTSIFACRVLEIYLNGDGDTAEIPSVVEGDRSQAPKSILGIDLGLVQVTSICLSSSPNQQDYECSRKRNNDRHMVECKGKEDVELRVKGRNEIFKDVTPTIIANAIGDQLKPNEEGALGITVPAQMLDRWEDYEMAKALTQCKK